MVVDGFCIRYWSEIYRSILLLYFFNKFNILRMLRSLSGMLVFARTSVADWPFRNRQNQLVLWTGEDVPEHRSHIYPPSSWLHERCNRRLLIMLLRHGILYGVECSTNVRRIEQNHQIESQPLNRNKICMVNYVYSKCQSNTPHTFVRMFGMFDPTCSNVWHVNDCSTYCELHCVLQSTCSTVCGGSV